MLHKQLSKQTQQKLKKINLSFFEFFLSFFVFKFRNFLACARASAAARQVRPAGLLEWVWCRACATPITRPGLATPQIPICSKPSWIFLKGASGLTRLAWKLMEKASRGEVSCVVTLPPCITILASYALFEILLLDSCKSADVLEIVATLMLACCTQHSALVDAPTQGFQYLLWPKYLAFLSLVRWNNSFFEIKVFCFYPLEFMSPQCSSYFAGYQRSDFECRTTIRELTLNLP